MKTFEEGGSAPALDAFNRSGKMRKENGPAGLCESSVPLTKAVVG